MKQLCNMYLFSSYDYRRLFKQLKGKKVKGDSKKHRERSSHRLHHTPAQQHQLSQPKTDQRGSKQKKAKQMHR